MKLKKENTECAKAVLMLVLRKWETSQINNLALNLYLGEIEKQHTKRTMRKKIKSRAEINEIQARKTKRSTVLTDSFKNRNKNNTPLFARIT